MARVKRLLTLPSKPLEGLAVIVGEGGKVCEGGEQGVRSRGAPDEEFRAKGAQPWGPVLALVLLKRDVEVRAAKAKRADRGAAGVRGGPDPGSGLGVECKRGCLQAQGLGLAAPL